MKKFITIAALAAVFSMGVSATNAATLEETIAALQAQIAALSGATTTGTSMLSDHNGVNLKVGVRGTRVSELQACMNAAGYNTGVVDGIFGNNTKTGVMAFQASKGLVVDGIVGVATTPAFQAACATTTVVVETETETTTSVSGFDTNDGDEADFSDFDLDDADDDTIEEGEDKAELAEYVFELEDEGAALLERMDIIIDYVGTDVADENDAWEVFNTLYLMVDGDVIAEMDADDEDDWDDTSSIDEARFRMSGINHVFDADEEHTIVLAADIAGSVDLGSDGTAAWEVSLTTTALRFVDEAGITQYLTQEAGSVTDTANFAIEEEGQDDELDVQSSNDDPESTTLKVEDDKASDDYTVFIFELEADEDSADIELDKVGVTVTLADALTAGATFDSIVKDATLVIDGEEFDDVTVTGGTTLVATLVFDIDKDFTVESGDTVDAELVLEFASANGTNYAPGATVQASVLAMAVTGEGADDLIAGGSATGDVHTLAVEGIISEVTDSSATKTVEDAALDIAELSLTLDVEAFEENAFVNEAVASFQYSIVGTLAGGAAFADDVNGGVSSLSSTGSLEGSYYRVNEGDAEEFVLSVSYQPAAAGSYRLRLDSITFADDNVGTTTTVHTTLPVEDYRTAFVNITA